MRRIYKNKKSIKSATYIEFCEQELNKQIAYDDSYNFHGKLDEMYAANIAKDFFISSKQLYTTFKPEESYSFDLLTHLNNECKILFRDIDCKRCCEYVFKTTDGILVYVCLDVHSFEQKKVDVVFYFTENGSSINTTFDKFLFKKERCARLGVFKRMFQEIVVHELLLTDVKEFEPLNYNADFEPVVDNVVKELEKHESGIYLFYGEPGTGKSSFIRNLTSMVDRQFIFVPTHLFKEVFSLDMLDMFLDRNKAAVLVIEDAEKLLLKRESEDGFSNSETVSAILNITDGLYADLTKLSIIATYNCDRSSIDPAILRKGRLKAEYKFTKLKKDRILQLIEKKNLKLTPTEDMTLADIYNINDTGSIQQEEKRQIGFAQ